MNSSRRLIADKLKPVIGVLVLGVSLLAAQQPGGPAVPLVKENATARVSEHVYVIPDGNVGGVPNVGIVVGSKAVLVIDTGLGPKNGETVLREVKKLSNADIYIVGTHFHSEHILGESAFPASAKVIRARAQQRDIEEFGVQPNFATRSAANAELMKDAKFRAADELFDSEKILDLGDVRVRLLWYGRTHTNGDTLIFIEGDRVLFAGDVLMNRRFLAFNNNASVQAWIDSIDKVEPLRPIRIVPCHGEMGDESLIESNRAYLKALQTRVADLKREGKTVDQTADTITTEFRAKYPNWAGSPAAAARVAYGEAR